MSKHRLLRGVYILLILIILVSLPGVQDKAGAAALIDYYFPFAAQAPTLPHWVGPYGGSVVSIANDPNTPNTIYVGSWGGGVYKSIDGGLTWKSASTGLGEMKIDSLAVDPVVSTTLYAGTHGDGVYKSVDGGTSWTAARSGMQNRSVVYSVTVNPGNHNIIYAGTRGIPEQPGPPWLGVLYKSTNGGSSWYPVLQNIGGTEQQDWIYSVRVNPNSPDMVIAAAHEHGLWVAYDYGDSGDWFSPEELPDWSGRAVAFDPRSWVQTAFYATWHGDGIYRSYNGAYHWEITNDGLGYAKIYPNGIVFDSNNPSVMYLASFGDEVHGVMKSDNNGDSWDHLTVGDRYIYSVGTLAHISGVVFAGTLRDGIYKSIDGGTRFYRYNKGISNTEVTGVVFKSPNTIYASTTGQGIFRSLDGGSNWVEFNSGLTARDIKSLVLNAATPNLLYALTGSAGLQVIDLNSSSGWHLATLPFQVVEAAADGIALDTNESPFSVHEPIEELLGYTPSYDQPTLGAGISYPVLSMTFAPSNSQTAYVGTDGSGMYKTLYGGSSFGYVGLSGLALRSIAIHPTTAQIVYVATNQLGVVKYTNNGAISWSNLPAIPGAPSVYSVAVLAADTNAVYAGTSLGVWRYASGSWTSAGFSGVSVPLIKASPYSSNQLFAAMAGGVYTTLDHKVWTGFETNELKGLMPSVLSFGANTKENFLFIGTTGHGIFQMSLQ